MATLTAPGGGPGYEAFSPDGKLLAIADGDGNIYVRVTSQFMA